MKLADERTEMDRLLQYLSEAERAEFLHLYYRVFKHTDPNDELITIFRALYFGYLLTAKVPERMAVERKELQGLVAGVVPAFQKAVKDLGSKFDQQVAMMDQKSDGLQNRLTELSETARHITGFGDWLRSPEGVEKQSAEIAKLLLPVVHQKSQQLLDAAADLKAESLNIAAQGIAKDEYVLSRLRAIEAQLASAASGRERGLNLSFWSAGAASAILLALGVCLGRFAS